MRSGPGHRQRLRGLHGCGRPAGGGAAEAAAAGAGSVSVSSGTPVVVNGQIINSLVIRGKDQVMLKVTVVEVRRDIVKQLGVSLTGAWSSAAASVR